MTAAYPALIPLLGLLVLHFSCLSYRWFLLTSDETLFKVAEVCTEYKEASLEALRLYPDRAQGKSQEPSRPS